MSKKRSRYRRTPKKQKKINKNAISIYDIESVEDVRCSEGWEFLEYKVCFAKNKQKKWILSTQIPSQDLKKHIWSRMIQENKTTSDKTHRQLCTRMVKSQAKYFFVNVFFSVDDLIFSNMNHFKIVDGEDK